MKFIAYYRVSTQKQGRSGLGLDAQKELITSFVSSKGGELVDAFEEHESGKGANPLAKRVQLQAALEACRRSGAALVIAKLDRLARDVRFFLAVLDDYGVDICFAEFADMDPKTDEGRMLLINMANFAEFEGRRISTRTKAAITAKRHRVEAGTDKSGKTEWSEAWGVAGAANLKPNIEQRQQQAVTFAAGLDTLLAGFKLQGLNQREQVDELNKLGIKTPMAGRKRKKTVNGKKIEATVSGEWSLMQLQRVLKRLKVAAQAEIDAHPLAGSW